MSDTNARLTLRMVPTSANVAPYYYMKLTVEDAVSGQTFVEMELTGEHLLDLLGNRLVGGVGGMDAWLLPEPYRSNLGRKHRTTTRRFPITSHDEEAVRDWCEKNGPALGAASWTVGKQNTGLYRVVWHHYLDDTGEQLDAVMGRRQETMDVIPGPASKAKA